MDTTETYIKMALKSSQDLCPTWKWRQGDWAYSCYYKQVGNVEECAQYMRNTHLSLPLNDALIETKTGKNLDYDTIIPLPRQDQLQEMMGGASLLLWNSFMAFMEEPYGRIDHFPPGVFSCLSLRPIHSFPDSFEQLWLAFVMKEKYGKVWSNEEWVKEI